MQISANNISIEVEVSGPENGPVILLTRGLGTQMTEWAESFYNQLECDGYRVVRYDNRGSGLSEKMGPCETDNILPEPDYTIYDMAADSIGVLDALKIERAHLLGISMGGMISQVIAAHYPERVISLISVMSSAGEADPTENGSAKATDGLTAAWPPASDREEIIAKGIDDCYLYGSRTHRPS
ncbi:MAG: alpha/beta fold hydrolase, partial [Rhodospirillaceae bacterium]|nr:alpha/beta fold hydrolase [Rhodospirillaceae bacterium]